jgi:hypothetical protein
MARLLQCGIHALFCIAVRLRRELLNRKIDMLTAVILICSITATPNLAACNPNTAIDVIYATINSANPSACIFQGQALLARTAMGRNLGANERIKIICRNRKAAS